MHGVCGVRHVAVMKKTDAIAQQTWSFVSDDLVMNFICKHVLAPQKSYYSSHLDFKPCFQMGDHFQMPL